MTIREIRIEDYKKLIPFWKENYFVSEIDNKDRFKLFLEKNPSLSVLAEDDGVIVGTALGSFDGRRGYLQKVVVDKNLRNNGIGQQLVAKIIEKLKSLSVLYIPINVQEDLVHFYGTCGFKKTTQIPMSIEIK